MVHHRHRGGGAVMLFLAGFVFGVMFMSLVATILMTLAIKEEQEKNRHD